MATAGDITCNTQSMCLRRGRTVAKYITNTASGQTYALES